MDFNVVYVVLKPGPTDPVAACLVGFFANMSWKTWQSSAWDSNPQASNKSWGSTNWSTPEKKKKNTWTDQQWDYASPTGVPYVEGLPEEFLSPTRSTFDSNEVFGKTMLRCVLY